MTKDRQFIQKCKIVEKTFPDGGALFNCSFHADELKQIANEQGWVNITIAKRREPSEKGATHYAYVNEFKPEASIESKAPAQAKVSAADDFDDDLPF